jgi:hypothetical protein
MRLLTDAIGSRDVRNTRAWIATGPELLTELVRIHDYRDLAILPSHHFMPEHYTGVEIGGPGKVYGRHHWASLRPHVYDARFMSERHASEELGTAIDGMGIVCSVEASGVTLFHIPKAVLPATRSASSLVLRIQAQDGCPLDGTFTHAGREEPLLGLSSDINMPWPNSYFDFKFRIDCGTDRRVGISWTMVTNVASAESPRDDASLPIELSAFGERVYRVENERMFRIPESIPPLGKPRIVVSIVAMDGRPLEGLFEHRDRSLSISGVHAGIVLSWPEKQQDRGFRLRRCGADRRFKISWWSKSA